jgi:hypothetical protein
MRNIGKEFETKVNDSRLINELLESDLSKI